MEWIVPRSCLTLRVIPRAHQCFELKILEKTYSEWLNGSQITSRDFVEIFPHLDDASSTSSLSLAKKKAVKSLGEGIEHPSSYYFWLPAASTFKPKSLPSKITQLGLGFFILLIIASYTATLTATLTP
eukprot:4730141-Amphidinium_carterae.1